MTDNYLDGWFAHKDGHVSSSNPYNENTQSVSYYRWMSGWTERFNAVKHELDLSTDEKFPW